MFKRIIGVVLASTFFGQTVAKNLAIDFTATDIHGDKYSLFKTLSAGMYVMLHFTGSN